MNYNYNFDLAALLLFLVVVIFYFRTKHVNNINTHIFTMLLFCAAMTPVLDIIGCEVIERKAPVVITYGVNMGYYMAEQATNFFFFAYVLAQFEIISLVPVKRQVCMVLPIVFVALAILTNPIHGKVFTYSNGVYQSGPFRLVIVWGPFIYLCGAVVYVIKKRHIMKAVERLMVYGIVVTNVSARVIQYFHSDILVYSYSAAICVLMVYMYLARMDRSLDPHTGLANRSILENEVNRLMNNEVGFCSVFVRIADYDLLTTTYGIAHTEKYMMRVAELIAKIAKQNQAYQVGNNCYVLHFFENEDMKKITEQIGNELEQSYHINGVEIIGSYFVTCIEYPKQCADHDMYIAYLTYFQKMQSFRYGYVPFEELQVQDKARENQVERAVELAIKEESFDVYYQPICRADNQEFVTAEALVRLKDPTLGMISPGEFIPIAEANGTIIAIGNIVLDKVCQFIEKNSLKELGIQYIEMNLSTTQCLQRNFIETVDGITSKYQVTAKDLCFEITETASNVAPAIFTDNLSRLRERGYHLALDDFGTGYANLQRLVTTEFDVVKFDKEMTERYCGDSKLHDMFEKLQTIFHSMGATVVAEGVETKEEYEYLKSIQCDYIQGYYFSKPLPEDAFLEFLREKCGGN